MKKKPHNKLSKEPHNKLSKENIAAQGQPVRKKSKQQEIGGPKGLDPVRYGDWEYRGRCIDF